MAATRLAELLVALSICGDLGTGQPPETTVRSCLIATALARRVDVSERAVASVYYTTLLQHVGCTAYAPETAALFGDDIATRHAGSRVDFGNTREVLSYLLLDLAKGSPLPLRVRMIARALRQGNSFDDMLYRSNCDVAIGVARQIGLGPDVERGLNDIYERWDGRGYPRHLAGADLSQAARIAQVATQAVLFHTVLGTAGAIDVVKRRAGTMLDPDIADALAGHGPELLDELDGCDGPVAALDAEPTPAVLVASSRIDAVATAFGNMADLTSQYFHGHSIGVARLAYDAANLLGLSGTDASAIRRAGHLQDLGRVAVSSGIWNKPGPLTTSEWDQVRLHPYHSERILMRSEPLAALARLAGLHHERLDGSGYHRQMVAAGIPMGARLLAVADGFQAMTETRPWRDALSPDAAARELAREAESGRLDADAVAAVTTAAGQRATRVRVAWPANLTGREVEVLRLAATGITNKEIATALSISPKTAGHHVQHIYAKIGVSTRAGAAMFAMEHDLLRGQLPAK